ncbi:MAG: tail fiber domain-containing protein [Patescibacteria group bacterium]
MLTLLSAISSILAPIFLGLGLNFALAWTGPTAAAPLSNTPTPVNIGATSQVKSGGLWTGSIGTDGGATFGGSVGIGTVSPGYKLDVSGTARATSDMRAPLFYDTDNTLYYADPAWWSSFNSIAAARIDSDILYDKNNTGYYVDPNNTSRLNYGIYDNLYSYGWMQTPIFYDSNNNGYFLDPDSTSNLNYLNVGTLYAYGNMRATGYITSDYGYWTRYGIQGPFSNNVFNFYWDGSCEYAFIDYTQVNAWCISDRRGKENIADDPKSGLGRVMQMRPVVFNFLKEERPGLDPNVKTLHHGFIADEMEQIIPSAVNGKKDAVDKDGNPEYQSINYDEITPILTKALQELNVKVEEQRKEIDLLKSEIYKLKNR